MPGGSRLIDRVALLIGTLRAIPSVSTALVAHIPQEGGPLSQEIEAHQMLTFGTTALAWG